LATRKTAKKTSKKATVNLKWNVSEKSTKEKSKKSNKKIKKLSIGAVIVAVLFMAVGAVGGYFGLKIVTKNDCFIINGKDEITMQIGQDYVDEGVKVVAFGKDDSNKVKIETNLQKNENGSYTSNEVGTFYIAYTVDDLKYGTLFKIQKIRLITFVEATEQDEIDNANQGGNA